MTQHACRAVSRDHSTLRHLSFSAIWAFCVSMELWENLPLRAQTLAESGIQTLPLQYVRSDLDELQKTKVEDDSTIQIPIIDLQGLNAENINSDLIQEIARASQDWGFFQIINHGISDSLIARVQAVGKAFFDLPLKEKELYANKPENPIGYGSKVGISPDAKLEWGDYYYHLVWPPARRDMDTWPKQPPTYIEAMDEYSREVCKLWERLQWGLSCGLGVDQFCLEEGVGGEKKMIHIRINYYPPCPQPDLAVGLAPHSDPNALTILLQDEVPGLQIRKNGAWVDIKCAPGALIVNIGDQLEILSNGKYKSIEHRSRVHKDQSRMSWAMFCAPPHELVVSPLRELVAEQSPPLYKASSYGDYLHRFLVEGLDGKGYVDKLKHSSTPNIS
eukprot:Gb_33402 [translate_table: standard]